MDHPPVAAGLGASAQRMIAPKWLTYGCASRCLRPRDDARGRSLGRLRQLDAGIEEVYLSPALGLAGDAPGIGHERRDDVVQMWRLAGGVAGGADGADTVAAPDPLAGADIQPRQVGIVMNAPARAEHGD